MGSLDYRLPVPSHVVGTDLITVQYDRAMIPYVVGLLKNKAFNYVFDPDTGDTDLAVVYMDTLIEQLTNEVIMIDTDYDYTAYIPPWVWTPQGAYNLVPLVNLSDNGRDFMYPNLPAIGHAFEAYTKLDKYAEHFLWIPYVSAANGGILRILINGVVLSDIDMYSASADYNKVFKSSGFSTPAGHCLVRLEIIGKNAASSGYFTTVSALYIQ